MIPLQFMTSAIRPRTLLLAALTLAGCGDDGTTSASGTTTASSITGVSASGATMTTPTTGTPTTGDASGSASGETGGQPTTGEVSGASSTTGDSSPLLDIGSPDSGFETTDTATADGCVAVDLVFVIDNSVSMGDYQNALSLAFPGFADAIVESLPPGTNLHIGVTSTTMGPSNSGSTTNCAATGDDNLPQDAFYETPDMSDNGINGGQGRLYKPGNAVTYYDIDTDAGPAEIAALKEWFAQAAKIGEGGSQIEMSAAAAGWVVDPANAPTNAGFLRDEGAVLALFFLQDEADQTPWTISGQPGGLAMLDKLAAAKAGCGGAECIIGGGFVNTNCLDEVPLGDLIDGIGAGNNVQELPDEDLAEDFPQMAADEMNLLLRDTLAGVIAQKCDEIMPPL
jgi:hypothetical protein